MVFSSLVFLFLFFPVALILYYAAKASIRNYVLLAVSLIFYAWGETQYILVMIVSVVGNYLLGRLIGSDERFPKKKLILFFAIAFNLAMLLFFKYTSFIVGNVCDIFNIVYKAPVIRLPLGISFFTFHSISYIVDVYKKNVKVQKNFWNLALYISLFPQLVAGPIIRYHSIYEQIHVRKETLVRFGEGVNRFMLGMFKKVLIANELGALADSTFTVGSMSLTTASAWLGIVAYTLQIFFDFSGYSDMAIGLGKMFGFDFPENFNYPYISKSVSEFWRRWHISLSTWFRDYLYIPLGGSRVSNIKVYRNLFIVWFLTGMWHGASWTFICWGLYFGTLIALERVALNKIFSKIWVGFSHIYLIFIVMLGWVFFRANSFSFSIHYLKVMFGIEGNGVYDSGTLAYLNDYGTIIIIGIIFSMPVLRFLRAKIESKNERILENNIVYTLNSIVYAVLFILCISTLISSTYNPFLYFRF